MAVASKIVTYEEWLSMPEVEDGKEEVVDGEIYLMPPPKLAHSDIIENLAEILTPQLDRKLVRVRISQFGVVIRKNPLSSRVPDLAVFVKANVVVRDGYIHSAPELVVEVLSPANTRVEMARKIADYSSISVPDLWIFSPEARTVEILHLIDGTLRTVAVHREGQIRPRMFPDVTVDVAAVWPE